MRARLDFRVPRVTLISVSELCVEGSSDDAVAFTAKSSVIIDMIEGILLSF